MRNYIPCLAALCGLGLLFGCAAPQTLEENLYPGYEALVDVPPLPGRPIVPELMGVPRIGAAPAYNPASGAATARAQATSNMTPGAVAGGPRMPLEVRVPHVITPERPLAINEPIPTKPKPALILP